MATTRSILANVGDPVSHLQSDELELSRWKHTHSEVAIGVEGSLCVVLLLSSTSTIERLRGGPREIRQAHVGLISVPDPATETTVLVRGGADILFLRLPGADREASVRPRFVDADHQLSRLATRAAALLHAAVTDPLALAELRLGFNSALAERPMDPVARGGLSRAQLNRALEAIETAVIAGIARSPSLTELANAAGVSTYHFAHQFRRSIGEAPYAYSMRRRIERARTMLLETDELASTIGYRCGFASPAHFVQRYRETIGVSPARYRAIVRG